MLKQIMFAACLLSAVVYGAHDAYSADCDTDTNCPCRDWAEVLRNMEVTANTPGPENRGCAEVRVIGGNETPYDAFKHCNSELGATDNLGRPMGVGDMYKQCAPYACNWLRDKNWRRADNRWC
jgi:hypothetical protein